MTWVATLQDLFTYGLPGAVATPEARQIQSVDFTSGTFELPGHALFGGELVRVRPAAAGTVPTGLSARTRYTVATPPPDPDFFTLLLGGSPVSFTDNGIGVLTLLIGIEPKLQAMLLARTSWAQAHFKAYAPRWVTPPDWAPMIVAQLVAYDAALVLRVTSPQYKLDDLKKRADDATAFCLRGDTGEPYYDGVGPVDQTPTKEEAGALAWAAPPRHWGAPDGDLR